MELDGNTFVFVNKKYNHANLAMWGTGHREMGTYELKIHMDQFWMLKEDSNHPGYYYICNVKFEGYRLAKFGQGDKEVGSYGKEYAEDQLWKFVNVGSDGGDNYYRIHNFKYPDAKLTKFGTPDTEWGTYDKQELYDDQVWKLVPRFKADVSYVTIWSADNRTGSIDFSEEKTVTTGLKLTSSTSISTTVGLEQSLKASAKASLGFGEFGVEVSMAITSQIERSLSQTEEKSWSSQSKIKFTAPKGKNYRVKQATCDFTSPLVDDNCRLSCNYKVEETDGEFPN